MKNYSILVYILLSLTTFVHAQVQTDTLVIDGVTILRSDDDTIVTSNKKGFFKKLNSTIIPKNVKTDWFVVDLGISNFVDNTNYAASDAQAYAPGSNKEWFEIMPFRSKNVNIWIVSQKVNLLKHVVNLQYGIAMELNNYFYKQPIRYDANHEAIVNAKIVSLDPLAIGAHPTRVYKKNKLAADYVTIPLMLNFNLTPNRLYPFELSTGISVGYLFASRNKTVTSDEGKKKAKDDFDLNTWKLSYVGELSLGVISLYASYGFKSMYKRGLDMTPYTFGIKIRPASIFSKIENE